MESTDNNQQNEKEGFNQDDAAKFENPSVDPGFSTEENANVLTGREDKRENNIDVNMSIKEMREGQSDPSNQESALGDARVKDGEDHSEDQQNDALNYKNDRENGAYNPKNI